MAISCRRSRSSSTSRTRGVSFAITLPLLSSETMNCCDASLRSVGQRTRRTARQRYAKMPPRSPGDHGDLAAVGLDQLARDGKAQAAALDAHGAAVGLGAPAEEQVEDRLALL